MKPRVFISRCLTAGFLLSSACCSGGGRHARLERPPSPEGTPFDYVRTPPEVRITPVAGIPGALAHRVTLRFRGGGDEAGSVRAIYSRPPASHPLPLLILLPALAGDHQVTGYFARYLTGKGYACLQPETEEPILDPGRGLPQTREGIRRRVIDTRRLMDWALERKEIAPAGTAVLGISMGALVASLVAATDARVHSSVLILGGGDLARILVDSSEGAVRDFRRSLMRREGWTKGELRRRARLLLGEVDPIRYADRIDPDRTLIVEALFDRVIPSKSRRDFWIRAGRPPRILLPAGHYSSMLLAPYVRWRTFQHLRTRLEPRPAVAALPPPPP